MQRGKDYCFALSYPSLTENLVMTFQNWGIVLRDLGKCFFKIFVNPKGMITKVGEAIPFKVDLSDEPFRLKMVIKEGENGEPKVYLRINQFVLYHDGGVETTVFDVPFLVQDYEDLRTFAYDWMNHYNIKPELWWL
jgi:hypothetical protein